MNHLIKTSERSNKQSEPYSGVLKQMRGEAAEAAAAANETNRQKCRLEQSAREEGSRKALR